MLREGTSTLQLEAEVAVPGDLHQDPHSDVYSGPGCASQAISLCWWPTEREGRMCWSSQGTLRVPHCCPQLLAQWSKGLAQEEVGVLSSWSPGKACGSWVAPGFRCWLCGGTLCPASKPGLSQGKHFFTSNLNP